MTNHPKTLTYTSEEFIQTTDRQAFASVLPAERHIVGKSIPLELKETTAIRAIIWQDSLGAQKLSPA